MQHDNGIRWAAKRIDDEALRDELLALFPVQSAAVAS